MTRKPRKVHFLAEWVTYRKLSYRKLALRLEREPGEEMLSSTSLNRIANSGQPLDAELLHALAEAFDCGPEDILTVNPLKEPEVVDLMAEVRRIRMLNDKSAVKQATRNLLAVA
jgi:transcriptional regulator with XRE-family HTH domain